MKVRYSTASGQAELKTEGFAAGRRYAIVLGPLVGGFVAVAAFLRTMYRGAPETRKPKTQRDRYQASEDPESPNPAFDD